MNILFVGFGNIAERHFQSIISLKLDINYYILDKNLLRAKKIKEKYNILKIKTFSNFYELKKTKFFLVINSTPANKRYFILNKIKELKPKHVLVEKLLENNVKNLNLMKKKKYKSFYINFPYRMTNVFDILKKKLNFQEIKLIKVNAINWNLSSNSIHYIDLFSQIMKKNPITIYSENLKQFNSKREGYIEFSGKIIANFNSLHLKINNMIKIKKKTIVKLEIYLKDKKKITYTIGEKKIKIGKKNYNTKFDYQSELTKKFLKKLIIKKKIELPKLKEHIDLNIMYLNCFRKKEKIMVT
tara:strand:+ start:1442 stop:2338 length:897 start_codon:yes stop_codon:yes gene_type:complete